MIQEQEELFEHLGSSHEATKQRAKLQSRHLQSGIYIYILLFFFFFFFLKKKKKKFFLNLLK